MHVNPKPNPQPNPPEAEEIDVTEIVQRIEKLEKICAEKEREAQGLAARIQDLEESLDDLAGKLAE